jgi:hypothetical protein
MGMYTNGKTVMAVVNIIIIARRPWCHHDDPTFFVELDMDKTTRFELRPRVFGGTHCPWFLISLEYDVLFDKLFVFLGVRGIMIVIIVLVVAIIIFIIGVGGSITAQWYPKATTRIPSGLLKNDT